jgi:hypothetical protein
MSYRIVNLAFVALLMLPTGAISKDEPERDEDSASSLACVAKRTDPIFAPFDDRKEDWQARYQRRKAEFHPKMMEYADELGRCVERALRRDLIPNSRTTFGVHVGPDGSVAHVAVLDSNHANNLYGNCLARTLCKIKLTVNSETSSEIFTFNFNMRRKVPPNQRPWSLDPRE